MPSADQPDTGADAGAGIVGCGWDGGVVGVTGGSCGWLHDVLKASSKMDMALNTVVANLQ